MSLSRVGSAAAALVASNKDALVAFLAMANIRQSWIHMRQSGNM